MKSVLCAILFFAIPIGVFAATYSNDTSSVDINYTGPAPIGSPDSNIPPDPGAGGGQETGPTEGTGGSGTQEPQGGVTIPVVIVTEGSSGGTGTAGAGTPLTSEDILSTLFGYQAALFGSASGSSEGEWGTITISGAKARAALAARGVSRLSLSNLLNSRFFTMGDFTLVAASKILENKTIEEVILTLDTLSLTYRSDGRLFAMFPFSYPIKLTVNPNGETREKRVQVKFPWYRFFLRTFVSTSELQNQIDSVLVKVFVEAESDADLKTKMLIAVTEAIELRFDTVQGTLK